MAYKRGNVPPAAAWVHRRHPGLGGGLFDIRAREISMRPSSAGRRLKAAAAGAPLCAFSAQGASAESLATDLGAAADFVLLGLDNFFSNTDQTIINDSSTSAVISGN